MPSNRCSTCQSYIHFVPGKGWVTNLNEKCAPSSKVVVPHIPVRNV